MYKIGINVIVENLDDFKNNFTEPILDIDDFSYCEFNLFDVTKNDDFKNYFKRKMQDLSFVNYYDEKQTDLVILLNKCLEKNNALYFNITSSSYCYSYDYIYKLGYYISDYSYNVINIRNNYKKTKKKGLITLDDVSNLDLSSYFFKRDIIGNTIFDMIGYQNSKIKFILDILSKTCDYYFINDIYYKTDYSLLLENRSYYLDDLRNFFIPYLKNSKIVSGEIPLFIKKTFFKLLLERYLYNINGRCILNSRDEKNFYKLTTKVLEYIDSDIIINYNLQEKWLLFYLYDLKKENNKLDGKTDLDKEKFTITNLCYQDKDLIIEGYLSLDKIYDYSFYLSYNGKKWSPLTNALLINKLFSLNIYQTYYKFYIPITDISDISFFLEKNNKKIYLNLAFAKVTSRLTDSIFSYFKFNDKSIYIKKKVLKISSNIIYNFLRRCLSFTNIINLYYCLLRLVLKRKNILVLFNPTKGYLSLVKKGYKIYYIDNGRFEGDDKIFKKLRNNSYYSKLVVWQAKVIISDNRDEVIDYLDIENNYFKNHFYSEIRNGVF